MNIVCLNGSPRVKGNSATIAARFCEAAEKAGAQVKNWYLNKLDFRGCQSCYGCKKTSDRCVLKDDLAEVLEAVHACDVMVLASPVYYGDVSAQLKAFIDRNYSLLTPEYTTSNKATRLAPGKKAVFILTQGDPNEKSFSDIYPKYSTFFKWMGFEDTELIRACGLGEAVTVEKRKDIMKQAEELARKLVAG